MNKKITAKVSIELMNLLNRKLDAAFMKRDAYLSHIFALLIDDQYFKIPKMKKEESVLLSKCVFEALPYFFRNDPDDNIKKYQEARKNNDSFNVRIFLGSSPLNFVPIIENHKRLAKLYQFKTVSFSLKSEVVAKINSQCEEKNVSRDLFINRAIYLLITGFYFHFAGEHDNDPDEFYEDTGLEGYAKSDWYNLLEQSGTYYAIRWEPSNMLDAAGSILSDPFDLVSWDNYEYFHNYIGSPFPCFYSADIPYSFDILDLIKGLTKSKKIFEQKKQAEHKRSIDKKLQETKKRIQKEKGETK